MAFPASTYRVQLHNNFRFKDLKKLLPYLKNMGISTIYASPVFQSVKGSTHGYDVTDSLKVNKEIGTLGEWRRLKKEMNKLNMSWLQDVVPNHMALSSSNPWIYSIMERGKLSPYMEYFDINWDHPDEQLNGKLMVPFLGDDLAKVIHNQEIKCVFEKGFYFRYYEHSFPLSEQSYSPVLKILAETKTLDPSQKKRLDDFAKEWEKPAKNQREWLKRKQLLISFLEENLQEATEQSCENISADKNKTTALLQLQNISLTHWRTTEKKINYRRFFSINDLICLKMEDEKVFENYHRLIKKLCEENIIDGLRIDHIDGLYNPGEYLERLRRIIGNDKYLIVEKILEWDESLPPQWPIQGSSGYHFLSTVNQLFINTDAENIFTENYNGIYGSSKTYRKLIFKSKESFAKSRMKGELQNLITILEKRKMLPPEDFIGASRWKEALGSFLAAWPVYRIYPTSFPLNIFEKGKIYEAYDLALEMLPGLKDELEHLMQIFQGHASYPKEDQLYFLQRCQQFTGPLAAKGVEDTVFYFYNRLISHNEVGDTPTVFGIDVKSFHQRMVHRRKSYPFSVNATATHDTKRGEDARMRINALSDMPGEWFAMWQSWHQMNRSARVKRNVPDENEEYFIYQALIGAYTYPEDENLLPRTKDYLKKCLREAKVHSNWSEPDEDYEKAVLDFVQNIFNDAKFMNSFHRFQRKISTHGLIKSLGQTLLKVIGPGIPDIYQGTEFPDFSYVDPDNRRPVDYKARSLSLEGISAYNSPSFRRELLKNHETGRLKMFALYHALRCRLQSSTLFTEGNYTPLKVSDRYKNEILAFARDHNEEYCLLIIPLKVHESCEAGRILPDLNVWRRSSVKLPEGFPNKWKSIYTEEIIETEKGSILLKDVFSEFPVALLKPALNEI